MADDWDLHAVVRGCAAASAAVTISQNFTTFQQDCNFFSNFQDPSQPRRDRAVQQELLLHDLYKPFFSTPSDKPPPPPPRTELRRKAESFSVSDVSKAHNPTPRIKRRKNHLKKVCHVAAENLSCDMWSWRKYGQKPIKGSPYPRGYYRCSTSKGCMARKQVERNRSDPGMFIVTYTAEHNHPMPTHRNSLAGSTRHKPAEPSVSPAPEKVESSRDDLGEGDVDDDLSVSKMALDDDFFAGLEEFLGKDCNSGHFPANLEFPWLSATTIAGGG